MGEGVTKSDLWDARDTMTEQFREGIEGVHHRLDLINGRVGRGEVVAGEHGVRLTNIERELFKRRRTDQDPDDEPRNRLRSDDEAPITRRDLKLVVAVIVAATAILGTLFKLLPMALKALP